MGSSAMSTLPTPGAVAPVVVRLGIPGLASLTDSMMAGSLYALVAEAPPTRYPLIASSLAHALEHEIPCTVVVPAHPEQFIARIAGLARFDMQTAVAEGRIQFFVMQENFSKTMFRFGPETFCRELDHFQIPDHSFFIFEQADDLLSLHDVSLALAQISGLKQWFSQHDVTGMLSFSRIGSSAQSLAALQCLMDQLGGITRIGGHRDGLEITFDYWHSQEGTVAAKSYPLQTLESGMLVVTPGNAQNAGNGGNGGNGNGRFEVQDAEDEGEPHFFFMDSELISMGKQMPGVWQHVDSLVGMMHVTREHHSATVILTFRRDTDLRQLAQTVHTLRHGLGRRARIVVQEKGASLRYQNEALLLRLGLNLVIHVDVHASRLPLLLASLKGQIFDRDIDINFEMALASVTPSGLRGYVLPARFVAEAQTLLERAETLDIPCALVLGLPGRDVTAQAILGKILMARSGDMVSFDQQTCYMFLNGCPETSLLMTLERVLGQDVGAAFVESRFILKRHEILAELAALTRAAERYNLPDYSDVPMRPPPARPAAVSAPAAVLAPTLALAPASAPAPVLAREADPARIPEPGSPSQPMPASELAPALTPAEEPARVVRAPFVFHRDQSATARATPPEPAAPPLAVPPAEPAPEPAHLPEAHVAAPVDMPDAAPASEGGPFHYGGELGKVVAFGKKEAPRATRASRKA